MRQLLLIGAAIWLGATLALRLAGQLLLDPRQPAAVALLFAVSLPLMFVLPRRLLSRSTLEPQHWALGAMALTVPGMLLDTLSTLAFAQVFPNLAPDGAAVFAAWILGCNGVALGSVALLGVGERT
jgi:Family of unknown function (DUF5367)